MRSILFQAAQLLAMLGSPITAAGRDIVLIEDEFAFGPPIVPQILGAPRGTSNRRRSKNAPNKRRLKANRLHVSRRTGRKHRRAA